jgi:hypothetical protein
LKISEMQKNIEKKLGKEYSHHFSNDKGKKV